MQIRSQLRRLVPLALVPLLLPGTGCRTLGSRALPEAVEVVAQVTELNRAEGGPHLYLGAVKVKSPLRYRGAEVPLTVVSFDQDLSDFGNRTIRTTYSRDELERTLHPVPDLHHGPWPPMPTLGLEFRSGKFIQWNESAQEDVVAVTVSIRQVIAYETGMLFRSGPFTSETGDSVIVEVLTPEKFRGTRMQVLLSSPSDNENRWRQLRGQVGFKISSAVLATGPLGWLPARDLKDVTFEPSAGSRS